MDHQISTFLHSHASSSPSPSGLGFLGLGIPRCSVECLHTLLSPALSRGPQFTPESHRCLESHSPREQSGAFGTHARTWRAQAGSSRAGSGEWNPPRPSGYRESCLEALFRKPDTGVGGARLVASALGLMSLWGQGAPCLEMKGMQPRSAVRGSSLTLLPRASEPQGATWPFAGHSRA